MAFFRKLLSRQTNIEMNKMNALTLSQMIAFILNFKDVSKGGTTQKDS